MQFSKNRLRLAGRAQSFPEIASRAPSHSCTTVQNQINLMPCSKAHLCTHVSVHSHLPTASPLLLAEVGLCQYWKEKEQQEEKEEGMTLQLILPASGQANQKCVKIVRKWKARSLYRALQYPISDFSGGRKIQIGN